MEYKIGDATVSRIELDTLPGLKNNVYAIPMADGIILIDAGFSKSSAALINNELDKISKETKKKLCNVIITHSHIDHFGGIKYIKGNFNAYAHHPDDKTIKNFRKNLEMQEQKLRLFLKKSGTPIIVAAKIRLMYKMHKMLFESYDIKELKEIKGLEIIYTPGHSPGHVCIGIEDALFTGDHILPKITPTQSPSYLTEGCGLKNYLGSLEKISKMNYRIAFPAHGEPFTNIKKRIGEIIKFHGERLDVIEKNCNGKTLYEIAHAVFGNKMKGYHSFLALMETAAHLEYLEENGRVKEKDSKYQS